MLSNGWEFYILNPFEENIKQTVQDKYNYMYNKAYDCLLQQLCIPTPRDILSENDTTFIYYIDCSGDNNIIQLDETYDYKFLKNMFLDKKFKKIKFDIMNYYKSHGIKVSRMYKDELNYFIELVTL